MIRRHARPLATATPPGILLSPRRGEKEKAGIPGPQPFRPAGEAGP